MKIIAPIKIEWLDISIEIINVSTGETVDTWTMTELSYGHYAFEFEWYVPWEDYYIRATDGWVNIYETTTWYENVLSDNIANKLNEDYKSGKWTMWNGMQYSGRWGWSTVVSGISIEQLNTSVEYIIWHIEKSSEDIRSDIKDSRSDIEWLLEIQADIETAMKLQKKDFIKVDVDYSKIIDKMNEIKSDINNSNVKEDIMKLFDKLDAYKELDISDIINTMVDKLDARIDNSNNEIVLSIKNNFKDLNNKISDLKAFNEKLDMKDRTKVIEDTYKLLEGIEKTWMSDILEKISNISTRVDMMSKDLELYFEE